MYIKFRRGDDMADEYVHWQCENYDCRAKNKIKRSQIEGAANRARSVALVCVNCGFVNSPQPGAVFEGRGPNTWLPCIPFEGSERRLPTGRTPDGWKDYMGRTLSRQKFMEKYQVDPQINWKWRQNGSPKAVDD